MNLDFLKCQNVVESGVKSEGLCITYEYIFLWVYVVNPYVPDRVYSLWIHLVLYLMGYSL